MAKKVGAMADLAVKDAPSLLALLPPDQKHNLRMTSPQVRLAVWVRASHRLARSAPRRAKMSRRVSAAVTAAVDSGHLDRCARPHAPQPSTHGTETACPRTRGGCRPPSGARSASLSRARNVDAHRKCGVAPSPSADLPIDRSRHHRRHVPWPATVSLSSGGHRRPQQRDGTYFFITFSSSPLFIFRTHPSFSAHSFDDNR